MEAYQTVFNIALYFSEALILFYYANSFFKQRYNKKLTILGIITGHIILFGIYYLQSTVVNLIAILVIYCLIFSLLYECKFLTAVFNTILLLVIMVSSEWIIIFITSLILNKDFYAYQDSAALQIFDITLSKLAYYIICLVLVQIFSKRTRNIENNSAFWQLMIMPAASVFALFVFRYISLNAPLSNTAKILCSVVSFCLLISNIIVFMIYEKSISNAAELYELQAMKQKQEIDNEYFNVLEQNNKDLKIFTHDIKNHLEQISALTDNKEIEEYISKLYGTVNSYSNVALSGNKTLDVIISKYNTLCKNKNIEIYFNVKTANLSGLANMDLATILNNLLDNAVEAASHSEIRKISVDIFTKGAFEVINIQNGCDIPPNSSGKKLFTSKRDKAMHGLGIESVIRTLKSYNGIFDWCYDEKEKIFKTTTAIPKDK